MTMMMALTTILQLYVLHHQCTNRFNRVNLYPAREVVPCPGTTDGTSAVSSSSNLPARLHCNSMQATLSVLITHTVQLDDLPSANH
jgi:hypothetical protein